MRKTILTICLFAMTSMACGSVNAIDSSIFELSTQQPTNNKNDKNDSKDDSKDDSKKSVNYEAEYTKQEAEVKRIYNELSNEKSTSRKYTELKSELQEAQKTLKSIRTTAKKNDVKITASKWETAKVK
ncbi:MAG: hypothetical protein R3Y49_02885 [Rikenellaceae bacterium]